MTLQSTSQQPPFPAPPACAHCGLVIAPNERVVTQRRLQLMPDEPAHDVYRVECFRTLFGLEPRA